jgi:hypothetical protein
MTARVSVFELRWVRLEAGHHLELQFRERMPVVDGGGYFCGYTEWTEWKAVPYAKHANPKVHLDETA